VRGLLVVIRCARGKVVARPNRGICLNVFLKHRAAPGAAAAGFGQRRGDRAASAGGKHGLPGYTFLAPN
jgi:hypothetical protein